MGKAAPLEGLRPPLNGSARWMVMSPSGRTEERTRSTHVAAGGGSADGELELTASAGGIPVSRRCASFRGSEDVLRE